MELVAQSAAICDRNGVMLVTSCHWPHQSSKNAVVLVTSYLTWPKELQVTEFLQLLSSALNSTCLYTFCNRTLLTLLLVLQCPKISAGPPQTISNSSPNSPHEYSPSVAQNPRRPKSSPPSLPRLAPWKKGSSPGAARQDLSEAHRASRSARARWVDAQQRPPVRMDGWMKLRQ